MARYQGNNAGVSCVYSSLAIPVYLTASSFRYQPTQSHALATPVAKFHQPQAFVPSSARRNEDIVNHRYNQNQTQIQNHHQNQNQPQYRLVTPDNPPTERRQPREQPEMQMAPDRYSHPNGTREGGQVPQMRRQPSISPDQRALITGIPARQPHSARQPLTAMNGDPNHNVSMRTPAVGNSKAHTEMRALNDSGFGMKAPMSLKKAPSNQPQRQSHAQQGPNQDMDRRGIEARSRVVPRLPTDTSGSYGDRLMALQSRVPQGRLQNGESSIRSEYQHEEMPFLTDCDFFTPPVGNVQPRMSM